MSYVVTGRCVDCRYTDCVEGCPVDCFYEIESPAMLVIDPNACICCGACVPLCPVQAIYEVSDVPEPYASFVELNRERWPTGRNVTRSTEPLPGAVGIDEIHRREGGTVPDP